MGWVDMDKVMDQGVTGRPLHVFLLLDCSGSMEKHGKIQALNTAIMEVLPELQSEASAHPGVQMLIRAMIFSDGAQWLSASAVPIDSFSWIPVQAGGLTATGQALELLAGALRIPPMPERALPPVIVLISDGASTDDYEGGLRAVKAQSWGRKAMRMAIAIGADANHDELSRFVSHEEVGVFQANNPQALVKYLKWATVTGSRSSLSPQSQASADGPVLPTPPPLPPGDSADWVDFDAQ